MSIPVSWQSATGEYRKGQARIQKFRLVGGSVAGASNSAAVGREGRVRSGVGSGKGCPLPGEGGAWNFPLEMVHFGALPPLGECYGLNN